MKDNAGGGTEPRVSQKWEKVQENREKLSGQMEWGSLLTYSSQGIISTHQCNAIPWRCNVPREYQSLAERWRSCPESVQMWEENSTGIKPLRCFLTKQPLPLQSQCPLPTDLPHEAERRVQTLSVSASLLRLLWDAVNLLNEERVWSCLFAVIFLRSSSSGFC